MRIGFIIGLLGLLAGASQARADEADWLDDVAAAQKLARQHNRPIFAVLH